MKGKGLLHWQLQEKAMDSVDFMIFSKGLCKQFKGDDTPYLYLDNLRVHYNRGCRDYYEEEQWELVFSPIYSSEFNPIGNKHY